MRKVRMIKKTAVNGLFLKITFIIRYFMQILGLIISEVFVSLSNSFACFYHKKWCILWLTIMYNAYNSHRHVSQMLIKVFVLSCFNIKFVFEFALCKFLYKVCKQIESSLFSTAHSVQTDYKGPAILS